MGSNSFFNGLKPSGIPQNSGLPDFGFRIDFVIKDWFFNTDNVKKHLRDNEREVLRKFGAYTRRVARRSMKNRPAEKIDKFIKTTRGENGKRKIKSDYYSKPGSPPYAHAMADTPGGGLKYGAFNILYAYDPARRSVVIGPRKKPERNNFVPFQLEYGGTRTNVKNPRRRDRKVGDTGAISIGDPRPGNEGRKGLKKIRAINGVFYDVHFTRLKTAAMVRRSEQIEEKLWGPKYYASVRLAPRPYMRPAFWKANAMLPRFWQQARSKPQVSFSGR